MTDPVLLDQYILDHISPEEDYLRELDRETHQKVLHPRMLSGHLQGQILSMISCMIQPQCILEIGTFTGYSALCLAKGLADGGKLHTIELDDELETLAQKYILKSGMADRIIQHTGDARKIISTINQSFDLVFIDADKRDYCDYYQLIFDQIRVGGFLLADNVLWDGKVVDPESAGEEQTHGIIAFNDLVQNDPRVNNVILPVRDGIMVVQKVTE
ncbi:MAG: O-methyltransferase [Bacteroidota bacterium]|nr:methyltransferase [Odoribacter sp.]MDP3643268.1 O-methyltransferase [Bacteroidota bacterium]